METNRVPECGHTAAMLPPRHCRVHWSHNAHADSLGALPRLEDLAEGRCLYDALGFGERAGLGG